MRTYQRLVIARGGAELGTINPAYPHNFLITNSSTGTLKIGSTGTRYNSLQEVGKTPETFVPPVHDMPAVESTSAPEVDRTDVDTPQEMVWPTKKKTTKRKKVEPLTLQADDSDGNTV